LPAILVLVTPVLLRAQETEGAFRYRGSGYFTFGGGACQHGVGHIAAGGGAEGFVVKGLTLGLNADYRQFIGESGFGTTVLTVGYHFVDRREPKKADPFVSVAPLGVGFRAGGSDHVTAAGHIAGGLNYWFRERMGVRLEGGVYGVAEEAILLVRIGLSFR
jgi:hypothetical protein